MLWRREGGRFMAGGPKRRGARRIKAAQRGKDGAEAGGAEEPYPRIKYRDKARQHVW
jgi:hypothetical protein